MSEFEREWRYFVFKVRDAEKYLTPEQQSQLFAIAARISAGRALDGKEDLESVVVEHDWPEYEAVWEMIKQGAEQGDA